MNPLLLLLACAPTEEAKQKHSAQTLAVTTNNETSEIDVTTLHTKMKSETITIIDVRSPQEYAQGHLPNAKNIPLTEIDLRMEELTPYKDREIFLVCASGRRSHSATQTLKQKGFAKAFNILGGTRGWQAKGFPTER